MNPNLDPATPADVTKPEAQAAVSKRARRLSIAALLAAAIPVATAIQFGALAVKYPNEAGD
jgi:hypothetical protein